MYFLIFLLILYEQKIFFRSQRELTRLSKEIKSTIEIIENEYGSKEDLNKELQEKLEKFSKIDEFHKVLAKSCQVIIL